MKIDAQRERDIQRGEEETERNNRESMAGEDIEFFAQLKGIMR